MLRVDPVTQKQLDAVKEKCVELDEEHGTDLVKQFEESLDYCAKFGDQKLEGKSLNFLRPLDSVWQEGDELDISHFNFGLSAVKPDVNGEPIRDDRGRLDPWYFVAMHYHNGGRGLPWDSIEISPKEGPHWSFHS